MSFAELQAQWRAKQTANKKIKDAKDRRKKNRKDLYKDSLPLIRRALIKRGLDDYYTLKNRGTDVPIEAMVGTTNLQKAGSAMDTIVQEGGSHGGAAFGIASDSVGMLKSAKAPQISSGLQSGSSMFGALNSAMSMYSNIREASDANTTSEKALKGTDAVLDGLDLISNLYSATTKLTAACGVGLSGPVETSIPGLGAAISGVKAVKSAIDIGVRSNRLDNIKGMKDEIKAAGAAFGYNLDDPNATALRLQQDFYNARATLSGTQEAGATGSNGADSIMQSSAEYTHQEHIRKAERKKEIFTIGTKSSDHASKKQAAEGTKTRIANDAKKKTSLAPPGSSTLNNLVEKQKRLLDTEGALVGFQRMMRKKDALVTAQLKVGIDVGEACFDCVSNVLSCAGNICQASVVAAPVGIALAAIGMVVSAAGAITSAGLKKRMTNKIKAHDDKLRLAQTGAALQSAGFDPKSGKRKPASPPAGSGSTGAAALPRPTTASSDHNGRYADNQYALDKVDHIITDIMDEVYTTLLTEKSRYQALDGVDVLHTTSDGKSSHGYWNQRTFKHIILYEMGVPSGHRKDIPRIIALRNALRFKEEAEAERVALKNRFYVPDNATQLIDESDTTTKANKTYIDNLSFSAATPTVRMYEKMGLKNDDSLTKVMRHYIKEDGSRPTKPEDATVVQLKTLPRLDKVAEAFGATTSNFKSLYKTNAANPFVKDADGKLVEGGTTGETAARTDYKDAYNKMAGSSGEQLQNLSDEQIKVRQLQMTKKLMRGESLRYEGSLY